MSTNDFFQEIEHTPLSWKEYQFHVPVFYQAMRFMTVSMLASQEKIRAILPSKRLKPYRITPQKGMVIISAYEYRESDLGPYNEVVIGIPVTIDKESPVFTGILRKVPEPMYLYFYHLPVNTEIARVLGVELAGYPKFIADIEFTEENNWLTCELKADNQRIFKLSGHQLPGKLAPRFRAHPITFRNGYILKIGYVMSEREVGVSKSKDDVTLELGEHKVADELRELDLGKIVEYQYCANAQSILTPVIESFSA